MKYIIVSICFSYLLLPQAVFSQLTQDTRMNLPTEQQYRSIKKYKAVVTLHNQQQVKGVLLKASNQEIILIPKDQYHKRYAHFVNLARKKQTSLPVPNVIQVRTSRLGKEGRGLGIGFGIGALFGLALIGDAGGYISPFAAAGVTGITGGLLGLIIGAIPSKTHKVSNKKELEELKKRGILY